MAILRTDTSSLVPDPVLWQGPKFSKLLIFGGRSFTTYLYYRRPDKRTFKLSRPFRLERIAECSRVFEDTDSLGLAHLTEWLDKTSHSLSCDSPYSKLEVDMFFVGEPSLLLHRYYHCGEKQFMKSVIGSRGALDTVGRNRVLKTRFILRTRPPEHWH